METSDILINLIEKILLAKWVNLLQIPTTCLRINDKAQGRKYFFFLVFVAKVVEYNTSSFLVFLWIRKVFLTNTS